MFNDFTDSEHSAMSGGYEGPATLRGKVIAITGGALGIGLATATLLAQQGASLSIADNQAGPLEEARAKLAKIGAKTGATVLATPLDVRDTAQVNSWIEHTVQHFGGRLDGAANLAGVFRHTGEIAASDPEDGTWDLVYDVNVKGLYKCLRAQLAAMEAAGTKNGSIVNASSVMGLRAGPTYAAYCSSKHAALGITRVAAKEAGPKGIRVNAICPGVIKTTMISNMEEQLNIKISPKNPMDRAGSPEEVAKLIAYLLGNDSSYITGAAMSIDGGSYP